MIVNTGFYLKDDNMYSFEAHSNAELGFAFLMNIFE